jgi:4-amino-4-deoxy-L-arabinose transferase-like glycosyltransferase
VTAVLEGVPAGRPGVLRIGLLATVLLLSAFIQFTVVARTTPVHLIQADSGKYVVYAWNLVHYHTFSHAISWTPPAQSPIPDKLTLPGYPAFLSLFLDDDVGPAFVHRVVLAQACLGVATCALTLLLALRLLPFGLAVAAGLLVAISPHLATSSTSLLTESLFAALLALAMYVGVRAIHASTSTLAALAGAVLGLASLVRPQMELFPWLLMALCLAIPSWRTHAKRSAVALLFFVAVTAPWHIRNLTVERAAGDPDLFVTTLYHGSFPGLMYDDIPRTAGYPYKFDPQSAEHSADLGSVAHYIADEFRNRPKRYAAWYLLGKPAMFLSWRDPANIADIFVYPVLASPYLDQRSFDLTNRLMHNLHAPLMMLALIAVLVAALWPGALSPYRPAATGLRLLALALAYVVVLHMIGAPFPRYSVPFRPLTYLLAIAMVGAIHSALNRRLSRNAQGAV